ncbi:MAG: hypothetical protein Kow0089_01090 [Desulfobulbaceae bacterium]
MKSLSSPQQIPISRIDFDDPTYRLLPWEEDPGPTLTDSIWKYGILHPPFLQPSGENTYRIVCGRKRLRAARGIFPDNTVFCRILEKETRQEEIFSLILEEASIGTPLSPAEQIDLLAKLAERVSMDAALSVLDRLGHKPGSHTLKKLLRLGTLGKPVLLALHKGTLQAKCAHKLVFFNEEDRILLVETIDSLGLGGSKQQQLIDLSLELYKRTNRTLNDILSGYSERENPAQPSNTPQQATALLAWLREKCFPGLSTAEKDFRSRIAALRLPPSMRVEHSPSFESDEIFLTLRFPDWESFRNALSAVRSAVEPQKRVGGEES